MMERISDHISWREATGNHKVNKPNEEQFANMKLLAEKVFEPIRNHFGEPIKIWSFFRSAELNKAIGGSTTSQHCKGEAIDIDSQIYGGMTNMDIAHYIVNNLEWDQMILEFGTEEEPDWIHISYKKEGNRKQILKALGERNNPNYINITKHFE